MQIVIPMSGFGERFRAAGFSIPKPLIQVEGKPIIHHVIDMFPGDHDFLFVCNSDHLANPEFRMRQIIEEYCPNARVFGIMPHKEGPVNAIRLIQQHLDLNKPTIVNYADFTCRWDFDDFCRTISEVNPDASVPAYKDFHPHSGGDTNYAYIQEINGRLVSIREKQPYTDTKTKEYASTGTYYFRTAEIMLTYFEKQIESGISVNGEYYVSTAIDLLAKDLMNVQVYHIQHFMQWGTPSDLADYVFWSDKFHELSELRNSSLPIKGVGELLILASGLGSRFKSAGYKPPKALLKISGESLLNQVCKVASNPQRTHISVLRNSPTQDHVAQQGLGLSMILNQVSLGQADSALSVVKTLPAKTLSPVTILPCDTIFADESGILDDHFSKDSRERLVVWVQKPSPYQFQHSESFGWVGEEFDKKWVAVKSHPSGINPLIISGAFSFTSVGLIERLFSALKESGEMINGELYLDSLIGYALDSGTIVELFEPSFSVGLGTPYEFETFRYWQSCFDRWPSHPYALKNDIFVSKRNYPALLNELLCTRHDSSEWD